MRVAIISDTHLPRGNRRLPDACVARLRVADLILHAGDLIAPEVLDELEGLGPPVAAVHGNVDVPTLRDRLPAARVVEAGGVRIGMVHDAGPARGRLERLRERFPDCAAVVFGHATSRCTSGLRTAFRSSTPAVRRIVAGSRCTPWARPRSPTAPWPSPSSSWTRRPRGTGAAAARW